MNRADRNLVISIGVIIVIFLGGYASLVVYTGMTSPFSIVMSQSMQHDPDRSTIGSIDTGDIVIVREPDKVEIQSYVEGTQTGYSSFGDYGSVIIYDRGNNQNPVIHRAILWLDYNAESDTWSAPSLDGYDGIWYFTYVDATGTIVKDENDFNNIRGTLHFEGITVSGKNVSINLDSLQKKSGFLTMGDNSRSNPNFDQPSIIGHLVSYEDIRSVPVFEIPWLGTLKILINGGDNLEYVPNSLPSFIMFFVTIFGFLLLIDAFTMFRSERSISNRLEQIHQWKR